MENINQIVEFIQKGNIEDLKKVLNSNPDLANGKTAQGISFLTFAAYCRNNEIIELIKQKKSSFDIYEIIIIGDLQQTKEYYEKNKNSVNQYSIDGFTALGLACFFGHFDIIKFLIELGADLNIPSNNDFNVTPLHSACATSNFKIAELLMKNGANVNAEQQGNVTPLHSASHNGQIKLVRLLIEYGADVNAKMKDGQTPLFMAEDKSFDEVSEYLKSKGGK